MGTKVDYPNPKCYRGGDSLFDALLTFQDSLVRYGHSEANKI